MKKIITIIIILFSFSRVFSQVSVDLSSYSFIDMNYNKILVPGNDSSRLKVFYDKLDLLVKEGLGNVNILHIGGSHVQADMLSHKVRKNIDANLYPTTQRGYIFPFSVAKTNNPRNFKVSYTGSWNAARNVQSNREVSLGVGGIAVYTNDPSATIRINLNPEEECCWNFDRLRLIGYPEWDTDPIRPVLLLDGDTIEAYKDTFTDSYVFDMPEEASTFEIGFVNDEAEPCTFIITGFLPEKDEPGVIYHAIGVNGAATGSYLNCEFFEKELSLLAPDLVVFGIGINDAANSDFTPEQFFDNYSQLLRSIENVNPNCAFLFITNNDSYRRIAKNKYSVNRNGLIARDVFYRLAEMNQGGVWDLFELMGGLESMRKWELAGLAKKDKIHFTQSGYELLGDLLYNALIEMFYEIEPENK